jgi:hypothetical protein
MTKMSDTTNSPVCGQEAQRELDCDTNEMNLDCDHCGYYAETEIVTDTTGKRFWQEAIRFPMDESGRVIRGSSAMRFREAPGAGHQGPADSESGGQAD